MPERIQRQRTKGWRMPENTVYVGRPSRWGNPFDAPWHSHDSQVATYGRWLDLAIDDVSMFGRPPSREDIRRELRGKDLACWCGLFERCHADVLLEIANMPEVAHA